MKSTAQTGEIRELPARLLSLSSVCRMTARSRSSLYRDIERGEFPAPLKTGRKSNAWLLSEVQDWINSRPRRKAAV